MAALGVWPIIPAKTKIGTLWRYIDLTMDPETRVELILRHDHVFEDTSTLTFKLFLFSKSLVF
jgi:hypothetical protein